MLKKRVRLGISSISRLIKRFHHEELPKCNANYSPLSPLNLFHRAVKLYPNRIAYVHGATEISWSQLGQRVNRFSSALSRVGAKKQDVVSVLAPNSPVPFEAHFGVLGAGAILHCINIRLDPKSIAFQLKHANSKILIVDSEFSALAKDALKLLDNDSSAQYPLLIEVHDNEYNPPIPIEPMLGALKYESFLALGDPCAKLVQVTDEWDSITVNYTSGTTGDPKGVVYNHRGAYLNSVVNALDWHMPSHPRYLWVVPLFHANGWCFPWTMAAVGGTSYFLRQIRAESLYLIIDKFKIEYICGAPVTMNTMLGYYGPERKKFSHRVQFMLAGSPPAPAVMQRFKDETNVEVMTAYGLTEVYGPVTAHKRTQLCDEHDASDRKSYSAASVIQTPTISLDEITVRDPVTMNLVPSDGITIGEVMMRGNTVMKGYLHNPVSTASAFEGGWFHTGDLAVDHGNGQFEIKDRSKDIIISGGENISSVEIENIFLTHAAVNEAAVVSMPDERWGEVPRIFLTIHEHLPKDSVPTPEEFVAWGRKHMAAFQAPKKVTILDNLPKNVTGKVQKFILRKFD